MRDEGAAERAAELLALDRRHVWHPYASVPAAVDPYLVTGAEGVRLRLTDSDGTTTEAIDAMSSWWAAIWGYRHLSLDAAAHAQIDRMSHVMFGGLTHEPAVDLATTLVEITPDGLDHVFLCDSGSVSVEVAAKMCLQYWRSRGRPTKRRLVTWRGGYHGDTLHPMSVCDPDGGMHSLWGDALPRQVFCDPPPDGFDAPVDDAYVEHLRSSVAAHADELAAIIVEPVVQGAGGMRFHAPGYVRAWRDIADQHDVLLILDEIATGFGRTGELFAADHAGITPDVMCVGKALTGGYLSMAATLCTGRVATTIAAGEVPVLAHGPTFMGNPLSAAVANASLRLLADGAWCADVARVESSLRSGLAPAREVQGVRDVRVLGAIGVIELDEPVDVGAATRAALAHGVWIRPFRNLIYAMPPYVTGDDDLGTVADAMVAAARAR